MPKQTQRGFSLVELLVAVAFTAILMAGMAGVYKSSITNFQTAGEKLSAIRRGRVAIDMLSDDLNSAGMFLVDLNVPPTTLQNSNPGFWVNPEQTVTLSDGTVVADQLLFYYDQALPFEGKVRPPAGETMVQGQGRKEGDQSQDASSAQSRQITIETGDPSFATMVQVGQYFIVKDQYQLKQIETVSSSPGSSVVTVVPSFKQAGAAGERLGTVAHSAQNDRYDAPVTFIIPAQMVRYSIQARSMDPTDPAHTVPCLVREQGDYSASAVGGIATVTQTSVLAEDVTGLKIYFSVDGGRTWLRCDPGGGWGGFKTKVNAALAGGYGRPGYQTLDTPAWFREIPLTVRVDVTTRTAQQRVEYSTTTTARAYKEKVNSLVLRPRHFGLSMQ